MDRNAFHRRLRDEILILDGAMGSLLQEWGLPVGTAPEEWNLTNPDALTDIHNLYVASGADMILTNTFGASRIKLGNFGLEGKMREINEAAVRVARKAARGGAWVAASVGPLGENLHPLGKLSFDDAFNAYAEQTRALADAGVDVIVLETFDDLRMVKAAAIASRESFKGPVIALMTFGQGMLTVTGAGPEAAALALGDLDIDGVGANCSAGPEEMLPVAERMARCTDLPLVMEPNAGLPVLRSGKTVFPGSPALLARYAPRFAAAGVNIVGGCCGTTPKHISAIRKAVKGMRPQPRAAAPASALSGRSRVTVVGSGPAAFMGERINPTANPDLKEAARHGKWSVFANEAKRQAEAGADVIDVNVGGHGIREAETMCRALAAIQGRVDVPLCIDTSDPAVVEAALKEIEGKALINSVTADESRLRAVLPLARKYGASVIGLALDEKGIPDSARGRLEAARRIVNFAVSAGMKRGSVFIDPLVMAAGAGTAGGGAAVSLEALSMIKEELNVATVMGVSNVSHGLPGRGAVNAHFLLMALSRGLDLPMVDPFSPEVRAALRSADLLLGRDPYARRFLSIRAAAGVRRKRRGSGHLKGVKPGKSSRDLLREAVIEGAEDAIVERIKRLLDEGTAPLEVTQKILVPALEEVGVLFNRKQFFLPQMVLSAEAVQKGFRFLKAMFKPGEFKSRGKIVIATVRGDIHEIGKNIVAAILENHGFEVADIGKDAPVEKIIEAANREKPDVIGLSALMTTTMIEMEKTVALLRKEGLPQRILVGGAVVTRQFADDIGADGFGADAAEAVSEMRRLAANSPAAG